MALKDILVHVDGSAQGRARLETAVNLAAAHEAHLIGLYVLTQARVPGFVRAQIPAEVMEAQGKALAAVAETAEAAFRDETARAGISAEWRAVEGEPVEMIALHARYSDVAVVGQRDPEGDEYASADDVPDRLILSIGRPALVVPCVGRYANAGERIMVAWDAGRLATRAVNDALPFMEKAKQVVVLAVNPVGGPEGHGEIPSADICHHLARHGIKVEAQHIHAEDVQVGDMLLSRAADEGIDLLVMGAYGHARWRELVLGGVTRHLLAHMTMPVLMSH